MPVISTFTNPSSRQPIFLALAVSIGLHMGLWVLNPSILLTGGRGFESPERVTTYPRLRLDRLLEARPRPEAADLEDTLQGLERDPAEGAPVRPEIHEPAASFAEMESDPVFMQIGSIISPMEPGGLPNGLEPETASWQSRPEILAIRERRIEERPDARPRQILSRMEAEEPVVDILPALENGEAPDPGLNAGGFPGEEMDFAARRLIPRLIPGGAPPANFIDSAPEGPWRPALRPSGLSSRLGDDESFVYAAEVADQLLRISAQAYFDPSRPDYRYVKIQLIPSDFEALNILPREVIFLLDASSRLTPETFQQVTQAVGTVLGELSPEDRFNLLLLQSGVTQLFEESQAATPFNLARARGRLAQTRPQGRGDLFAGLNRLLASADDADSADRLRIGVVITDGIPSLSVEESSSYIDRFTRTNRAEMSVFTVGVGRQVNRYLLDFLSFRNRGDSMVTEQTVQIGEALGRTLRGVRRPLLRHLTYRFAGGERLWVYPERLTHLYMDRPLILVTRVPADQEVLTFQVVGHSREGAHDMLYTMEVARIPPGPWSLRQDWAWQAVLNQVAEYLQTGDSATRERIQVLSRAYGISVPYALTP